MTKEFRDLVNKKVPAALQTTDFKIMLNLIKENNLDSFEKLKSFVTTKIGSLNLEIKAHEVHDAHPTTQLRAMAKEIASLSAIKEQFFKFLS